MAPAQSIYNVGTFGEMSARVSRWAREKLDPDVVNDAINDACESLWMAASLATLSRFISSPTPIMVPAQSTEYNVVSIADPTLILQSGLTPGGGLPARQVTFAYSYATDSGSQTKLSPAIVVAAPAAQLSVLIAPAPLQNAIGWNLFAGPAGRLIQQNIEPLPFGVNWVEPMAGVGVSPNGPWPPVFNTTADNIVRIARLDATNQSNTKTPWQQADIASTVFSSAMARLPVVSSFSSRAYDLVDCRVIEIQPAGDYNIDLTAFYVVRPRRMRFTASRLPFASIAGAQVYIFRQALSDVLLSLYEDEASESWAKRAGESKMEVCLAVANESWGKNNRVRPFNAINARG